MNLLDQSKLLEQFLSDNTYRVFEEFVLDALPKIIETSIRKNDLTTTIIVGGFKTLALDLPIDDKVDEEVLLKYMDQIPGCFKKEEKDSRHYYYFNTITLAQYYYEELQREEYQTGIKR